jgi:hypothetical protein
VVFFWKEMKFLIVFGCLIYSYVYAFECLPSIQPDFIDSKSDFSHEIYAISNSLQGIKSSDISANQGCDKVVEDKPFKGILEATLAEGATCLKGLGESSMDDFKRLQSIIGGLPKPRVFCGKTNEKTPFTEPSQVSTSSAHSLTNASDFPAIIINTDHVKTEDELKRLLFHEMLHWLGYKHSETFDLPYLSDYCCFNAISDDPNNSYKKMACDLIEKRPHIQSSQYLTPLVKLLLKEDRSHVAFITLNQQLMDVDFKDRFKEIFMVIRQLEGHISPEVEYIYLKALEPLVQTDSITLESDRLKELKFDDVRKQKVLDWYGQLYQAYYGQDTKLRDDILNNFKESNQNEDFIYQKCPWFESKQRYEIADNHFYLGFNFEKFLGNNDNKRTFKMLCQGF